MSVVTKVVVKVADELLGDLEREVNVELHADHTWTEVVETVKDDVATAVNDAETPTEEVKPAAVSAT